MLASGDRVYLRFRPDTRGTVARVTPDGFTITYDFPGRKPNEPRLRFTYPWYSEGRFGTGHPREEEE